MWATSGFVGELWCWSQWHSRSLPGISRALALAGEAAASGRQRRLPASRTYLLRSTLPFDGASALIPQVKDPAGEVHERAGQGSAAQVLTVRRCIRLC